MKSDVSAFYNSAPLNKYHYPQIALYLITILIIENAPSEN